MFLLAGEVAEAGEARPPTHTSPPPRQPGHLISGREGKPIPFRPRRRGIRPAPEGHRPDPALEHGEPVSARSHSSRTLLPAKMRVFVISRWRPFSQSPSRTLRRESGLGGVSSRELGWALSCTMGFGRLIGVALAIPDEIPTRQATDGLRPGATSRRPWRQSLRACRL